MCTFISWVKIIGGVLLSLHNGEQVHQMAGGGPHQVHFGSDVCGCHVGGRVWSSGHHHIGPGQAVHLYSVDRAAQDARSADHQQWYGGKMLWTVKSRSVG